MSFVAVVAASARNGTRPGQVHQGEKTPANSAPPDGEFSKFGIYEQTAPRPKSTSPVNTALPPKLEPGARIALVGNTLFERAQEHDHFEAMVQKTYPALGITVRTLAWSADEIDLQPRPANYADTEQHLTHEKADDHGTERTPVQHW